MLQFIVRRSALAAVSLLGLTLLVSVMLHYSGDPVALMMEGGPASPQQLAELRHELGLDRSFPQQYLDFIREAGQGDFGTSYRFRRPAAGLVFERLPSTVYLSTVAMLFALLIAIPAGIVSATRPGSIADHCGRLITLIGQSVPLFWLGILLVLIFSVELRLFPAAGWMQSSSIVLPAVTLGLYPMARIARTLRASLLEVLRLDYITTARAKGLRESLVIMKHALRNAAIPTLTITGIQFGAMLGASIVTETIFAWPGVGLLLVQAIAARDIPLIRSIVTINSFLFILVNLGTDIASGFLNPRLREP